MNENKRNNYEVVPSIHTIEAKSHDIPNIPEQMINSTYISAKMSTPNKDTGQISSTSKINVSNFGEGEVLKYSQFKRIIGEITEQVGLQKWYYSRADLKFDSFGIGNYNNYLKLNKLLTMLFTMVFTIKPKNQKQAIGLFTDEVTSLWVKNDDIEIQCYNKDEQSEGKNPADARFEVRRKRLYTDDISIIRDYWLKKFDQLPQYYNQLQDKINDYLIQSYLQDKDKLPKVFRNENDFVMQHQNSIFCHRQLVDLYQRMGFKNADRKARNYKARYGLERFSKKDIEVILSKYKQGIKNYFDN